MGVRLLVHGELPADGPLLVLWLISLARHHIVIDAALPCRFVSRPMCGTGRYRPPGQLGTLFIRARSPAPDAMRVVHPDGRAAAGR